MKKRIYSIAMAVFCALLSMGVKAAEALTIGSLKCEMLQNPAGVDVAKPRLSWQAATEKRDVKQTAYQVLVASSP